MTEATFDLYESPSGYVAVTSAVRQQILAALAERELELGDFARLTGRSKSTLSNLHVRELLEQGLVEARPHPTDARRKLYRLAARRVGSSRASLAEPVAGAAPASARAHPVPLPVVLDVLLAVDLPEAARRAQGAALGGACARVVVAGDPRDVLAAVVSLWEREGVARAQKLDHDRLEVSAEVDARWCAHGAAAVGAVLAGFLEGVARARLDGSGVVAFRDAGDRRVVLRLPRAFTARRRDGPLALETGASAG